MIVGGPSAGAAPWAGVELDYASRVTDWTTTNTDYGVADADAKVTGLAIDIPGRGLPCYVTVSVPGGHHSVAGGQLFLYLLMDGEDEGGNFGLIHSPTAGVATEGVDFTHRLVPAAGDLVTVEVGVMVNGAGTGTLIASAGAPMQLRAVGA